MDRNVDAIAAAYIHSAQGDCLKALQLAIADALADLLEAERRTLHAARLVSHGYARGEFGLGRSEKQRQRWHQGETSRTSHRIRQDDT